MTGYICDNCGQWSDAEAELKSAKARVQELKDENDTLRRELVTEINENRAKYQELEREVTQLKAERDGAMMVARQMQERLGVAQSELVEKAKP